MPSLRRSIDRGSPFGNDAWTDRTVRRMGLESTRRPRGRPRIQEKVPDTFYSVAEIDPTEMVLRSKSAGKSAKKNGHYQYVKLEKP